MTISGGTPFKSLLLLCFIAPRTFVVPTRTFGLGATAGIGTTGLAAGFTESALAE
uniref:Uncharacterized protein n=1 Tax=viral metagenome TaxID=1070528 RepID=A0A6C0JZ92_9ZZZZ